MSSIINFSTNQGWVKLPRELLNSSLFHNEKLWKTFTWCLLRATYKQRQVRLGRQEITLEPGQFIFGRHAAAKELNMAASTTWEYMKLLERDSCLDIKSNNKYSLITVNNWELWQGDYEFLDSRTDNKSTSDRQHLDTNKKEKKEEEGKEDMYLFAPAEEKQESNRKPRDPFTSLKQEQLFDEFWKVYPKKKSKGQAEKAWAKINPDLFNGIMTGLERAKKSSDWLKENGKYIPYPATWLNAKGWEDEHMEVTGNDESEFRPYRG